MQTSKNKFIVRLARGLVIFCAVIFGMFLASAYSPETWYFYLGFVFIAAGGFGVIVSLFLPVRQSITEEKHTETIN